LPQIQVWINNDDPANVEKIVATLDKEMQAHKAEKLKAFVIFMTDDGKALAPKLTALEQKTGAHSICMAYLSPKSQYAREYKVNPSPQVKNTFMLYREKEIRSNEVNLVLDDKGVATLDKDVAGILK
jgi:hypothetical protein